MTREELRKVAEQLAGMQDFQVANSRITKRQIWALIGEFSVLLPPDHFRFDSLLGTRPYDPKFDLATRLIAVAGDFLGQERRAEN